MKRLCLLMVLLAATTGAVSGQGTIAPGDDGGPRAALRFGEPVERGAASGDVHDYELPSRPGDLVSGTLAVQGLAGLAEVVDGAGNVLQHWHVFLDAPAFPIDFVVAAADHRLRISFFDRIDGGGPQWALEGLTGVVGTAQGSYVLQLDHSTVAERMVGVNPPVHETYPSDRLQRLSRDLQQGVAGALESFWHEVAGQGPLVEEIPGNGREIDVTFLWREIYDTRNVLLFWPGISGRLDDYFMSRLPGTDVWFKTVRLLRGSRFEYELSVNDRPGDRRATRQPDPLNPRRFPDDPTFPYATRSVLDTPGAPDEQWALRTPTRRGAIQETMVASALRQDTRPIYIYTPPGYTSAGGPYPLVLLFDGAGYVSRRFEAAPTTFDNLIDAGRIRPAIVVFDTGNRPRPQQVMQVGSVTEWVRRYSQELVEDVLPMLRSSYPISTNPADIIVGGFSAGGRAAAHVAFNHPEVFGNVLSQSGAFRARELDATEPNSDAQLFIAAPHKQIRFYLEVGLYDNAPSVNLPLHEMLLDETNLMGNRHFRDVLRAKGYDVVYREVGAGHEPVHWRAMLADGLMELLAAEPRAPNK